MGVPRKPSFPMRQLGRTLRSLREQARMSQQEVGDRLRLSDSKLSRIEKGQLPNYHEFLALIDLYGVIASDTHPYIEMYDRAAERGWWHQYGHDDRGFVSIEAEAAVVRTYQLGFVPGILQTETYMRRVFAAARQPLKGRRLATEVAVRLRQRRLTENPVLTVHAVIDETVLHREICDREQLSRILDRASMPHVTVQVIPQRLGAHSGLYTSFIVASFPDAAEPPLLYLDYGFGALQIEKTHEVDAAKLMFDHLADLALSEQASIELVERMIADM